MSQWSTIRRETGLVEHVCAHGVGHPNAGSILWMQEETGHESWGIHGCDGCCTREDFPGTLKLSLSHAHGIIRTLNARLGKENCDE